MESQTDTVASLMVIPSGRNTAIQARPDLNTLVELAVAGRAVRTAAAYRSRIAEFLTGPGVKLDAAHVVGWIQREFKRCTDAKSHGYSRYTGLEAANQRLAAVKRLARTAYDCQVIDEFTYFQIHKLKGKKYQQIEGCRWLNQSQVTALMNALYTLDSTAADLRNGALIALLLGCGLRCAEAARAQVGHLAKREGRWCLVGLVTKGGKVRSMGIPGWAWMFVERWLKYQGVDVDEDKGVFLVTSLKRGQTSALYNSTIWDVVRDIGALIDLNDLAPHDLRRTYAQLSLENGANIQMVQSGLGHGSLNTTVKYLHKMAKLGVGEQAGDFVDVGLDIKIEKDVPIPPRPKPFGRK